jgi:hypothetical protein
VAARPPGDHRGTAKFEGKFKGMDYTADFASFKVPEGFQNKLGVDLEKRTLSWSGPMSHEELKALTAGADQDQAWALNALALSSDWFESVLTPKVIGPVKKLRSWAFVLCFLCIGLSTRFKELGSFGMKPFWAFTLGVLVNVPLGYVLSTIVFVDFWEKI